MCHNIILRAAILAGLTFFATALTADSNRTVRGDETVNTTLRYTGVELKSDRVRFDEGDRIQLRFRVTNTGYRASRIYPFEPSHYTFQFQVLDERGRELEPLTMSPGPLEHDLSRNAVVNLAGQRVKEVILHPHESFEKTINLSDYYDLSRTGRYRITGYFYPDARKNVFIRSTNTIRIDVERDNARPAFSGADTDSPAGEGLSPEEAVYLFLSAELRRNWKNYLKYLDLPRYITSYERFAGEYARGDARSRAGTLERFRNYLTADPTDRLRKFRIMDVMREGSSDRATVIVEAKRATGNYTVMYEYTYTLEKTDGFWKIISVVARVAG